MRLRLFFIILISYVGIETMYSVNVSQVATVSFQPNYAENNFAVSN